MAEPVISLELDPEERNLLDRCKQISGATDTEALREGLRLYAIKLGVGAARKAKPREP